MVIAVSVIRSSNHPYVQSILLMAGGCPHVLTTTSQPSKNNSQDHLSRTTPLKLFLRPVHLQSAKRIPCEFVGGEKES
jgi:hypothetical protein